MMGRATWIEIEKQALLFNYELLKERSKADVFAVVKANAYGHGIVEISKIMEETDVPFICVSSIDEALVLYEAGVKKDILIFSSVSQDDIEAFHQPQFVYTLASWDMFEYLQFKSVRVHLEINVGMNRMGIKASDDISRILENDSIILEGIYTHFQSPTPSKTTLQQFQLFEGIVKQSGFDFKWVHLGNAPVEYIADSSWINGARFGLGLYGYREDIIELKPVLSLYSTIMVGDAVSKGETIGYDYTYEANKDMFFGSMPLGYGDGFMLAQNLAPVYLNKDWRNVLGKVCMDQTMVELKSLDEIGMVVEIIGVHRNAAMIQSLTGINPYILLTGLRSRILRKYI